MSKKTDAEKQGYATSAADRAKQDEEVGKADTTLDFYGGAPDKSPLYKSMLTSRLDSTNKAYDNASAGARLRGKMAGFGYETPIGQGAQTEVESERASDIAKAPNEALLAAVGPNMQAAGMRADIGKSYGQQGEGYFNSAAQAEARRRAALMQAIAGAGTGVASAFVA